MRQAVANGGLATPRRVMIAAPERASRSTTRTESALESKQVFVQRARRNPVIAHQIRLRQRVKMIDTGRLSSRPLQTVLIGLRH